MTPTDGHRAESPRTRGVPGAPGLLDLLVPVATLGTVAVNGLANSLRIGGVTTGEVSARYPTLVTPAGYAFSIWGLIYLALLVFSGYALTGAARAQPRWARLRAAYLASCALNALWIVVWHHRLLALSAAVIAALLSALMVVYRTLDAGRAGASAADRWLLLLPFSLYASWVTVATILNVAVTLTALGFQGGGVPPAAWALALLGVAAVLALGVALPRRDAAWLVVTAWALGAIAAARDDQPILRLGAAALAGGLLLAALGVLAARARH